MKKIVFLMFIIIVVVIIYNKKNEVLIPNNAIRIRIIANSNELKDQEIKSNIKLKVDEYLFDKIKDINSYKVARNVIKESINDINKIVGEYVNDFEVNYGNNYFPNKEYKGTKYKEGDYESLVIKLGEGKGNNFWCVLFPPLCMIDETKLENATYSLYIKELLKKLK